VSSETRAVYDTRAAEWHERRGPSRLAAARRVGAAARRVQRGAPVADLGCGPGWHLPVLGSPAVAIDESRAMLELVPEHAPNAWRVQADLSHLPFRRGSLAGAWASKSYVHVARSAVPMALWDLQRALPVGAPLELVVFEGDLEHGAFADDDFAGRWFSTWPADLLLGVVEGAGFTVDRWHRTGPAGERQLVVRATRARTLADTVGPDMAMLISGLNPSVYAADAGVGFARPGNRFWPAAIAAGIVSRPRDARHALAHHGVGMTDVVKRATPRADELAADEYRAGMVRLERLVRWLEPGIVVFVGLAGWRAAVDRRAAAGLQPTELGSRPVYVLPSTSGLNAATPLATLRAHLAEAQRLASPR
jgi:TDG/mug DNA glycosylase family protein